MKAHLPHVVRLEAEPVHKPRPAPAAGPSPVLVLALGVGLIVGLLVAAIADHRLAALEAAVGSLDVRLGPVEGDR